MFQDFCVPAKEAVTWSDIIDALIFPNFADGKHIFFIWMGIFNVLVVAQFWGFANDIYTEEAGTEAVKSGTAGDLDLEEYIGAFEAKFMMYFNLLAMIIQLFIVSRIFKWFGVRVALFILPCLALGGYFLIAAG